MLGDLQAVEAPTVVVSEVFGPTLQGEGPSLGLRAGFVRLGGCNLHCSWCDTPYTWDADRYDLRAELTRRSTAGIVAEVATMTPSVVVISGGEPLLWQGKLGWLPLLRGLTQVAPVEIETNGTQMPTVTDPVARYNVSPKLAHGGDPLHARMVKPALHAFAGLARQGRAALKVVVQTASDVHEAGELARSLDWPAGSAYVMPEGTDVDTLTRRHHDLADAVIQEGLNMTTRLHVFIWGTERAR